VTQEYVVTKRQLIFILILWFASLSMAIADTTITYKETRIPMDEAGSNGLEALLVWPDDHKPHPLALINHGSPRDGSARSKMSAIAYLPIAMEFARRGFAVAVVMRRGYGSSGGGWAEVTGNCNSPAYARSAAAASKDLHTVVSYLGTLPQFDINTILAVGVSAGGYSTLAFTADNPPPGLVAAISFAGGRGSKASDTICNADKLVATIGDFGKTSRVPTLWVYAQNDHFFNPTLAERFYSAFTKNGGHAKLIIAGPFGNDGHFLFSTSGIPTWTPIVDTFLQTQHLVFFDKLLALPDTSNLVAPNTLSTQGKNDFTTYVKSAPHKAFAVSPEGAYGWRTGQASQAAAQQDAMTYCKKHASEHCRVIAVDNEMKNDS
jgi:dienelactone hydrolase